MDFLNRGNIVFALAALALGLPQLGMAAQAATSSGGQYQYRLTADVNVGAASGWLIPDGKGGECDIFGNHIDCRYKWSVDVIDNDTGKAISHQYIKSVQPIFHIEKVYNSTSPVQNLTVRLTHHHLLWKNSRYDLGSIAMGSDESLHGIAESKSGDNAVFNSVSQSRDNTTVVIDNKIGSTNAQGNVEVRKYNDAQELIQEVTQMFSSQAVAARVERIDANPVNQPQASGDFSRGVSGPVADVAPASTGSGASNPSPLVGGVIGQH